MSHELKLESSIFFQRKSRFLDKSKEVGHFFNHKKECLFENGKIQRKINSKLNSCINLSENYKLLK